MLRQLEITEQVGRMGINIPILPEALLHDQNAATRNVHRFVRELFARNRPQALADNLNENVAEFFIPPSVHKPGMMVRETLMPTGTRERTDEDLTAGEVARQSSAQALGRVAYEILTLRGDAVAEPYVYLQSIDTYWGRNPNGPTDFDEDPKILWKRKSFYKHVDIYHQKETASNGAGFAIARSKVSRVIIHQTVTMLTR